jgi:hypothetical protein
MAKRCKMAYVTMRVERPIRLLHPNTLPVDNHRPEFDRYLWTIERDKISPIKEDARYHKLDRRADE